MKKTKIVLISVSVSILAVILAVVIAATLFVGAFIAGLIYEEHFKKVEIYREPSPSNEYVFVLYQVGAPEWPFGPVKAEVRVLDSKGKTLDKESVLVYTDGACLTYHYISTVLWEEDSFEIDFNGEILTSCTLEWNN